MVLEIGNKCGEIYRNGPGIFAFSCSQCNEVFNSSRAIFDHVESHFIYCLEPDFKTIETIETTTEIVITEFVSDEIKVEKNDCKRELEYENEDDQIIKNEYGLISSPELRLDNDDDDDEEEEEEEDNINLEDLKQTITRKKSLKNSAKVKSLTKKKLNSSKKGKPANKSSSQYYPNKNRNLRRQEAKKYWGHILKIDKNDYVQCDFCGNSVKRRNIRDHLDIHSTSEPKFGCTVCGKRFRTRVSFKAHRKIHKSEMQYSCDICGWMFREKSNLMSHIVKHTGAKPYKCKICGKGFSQSSYVNIHMRGHTGETPYKCTLCNDAFKGASALTIHIRIKHLKLKPFKCNVCDKSFARNTNLKDHQRTHTGEKPFACIVCGNTFARYNTLTQHMLLHSNEKPYKCRYCDLAFSQFAGRSSHEKSAHKV